MQNHPIPLPNPIYIRLICGSETNLPTILWLETLKQLITNQLNPIVSPLKRFVKHLNPIAINHLRTVSFKMKFLRFPIHSHSKLVVTFTCQPLDELAINCSNDNVSCKALIFTSK
jgi:hypothetical protein